MLCCIQTCCCHKPLQSLKQTHSKPPESSMMLVCTHRLVQLYLTVNPSSHFVSVLFCVECISIKSVWLQLVTNHIQPLIAGSPHSACSTQLAVSCTSPPLSSSPRRPLRQRQAPRLPTTPPSRSSSWGRLGSPPRHSAQQREDEVRPSMPWAKYGG